MWKATRVLLVCLAVTTARPRGDRGQRRGPADMTEYEDSSYYKHETVKDEEFLQFRDELKKALDRATEVFQSSASAVNEPNADKTSIEAAFQQFGQDVHGLMEQGHQMRRDSHVLAMRAAYIGVGEDVMCDPSDAEAFGTCVQSMHENIHKEFLSLLEHIKEELKDVDPCEDTKSLLREVHEGGDHTDIETRALAAYSSDLSCVADHLAQLSQFVGEEAEGDDLKTKFYQSLILSHLVGHEAGGVLHAGHMLKRLIDGEGSVGSHHQEGPDSRGPESDNEEGFEKKTLRSLLRRLVSRQFGEEGGQEGDNAGPVDSGRGRGEDGSEGRQGQDGESEESNNERGKGRPRPGAQGQIDDISKLGLHKRRFRGGSNHRRGGDRGGRNGDQGDHTSDRGQAGGAQDGNQNQGGFGGESGRGGGERDSGHGQDQGMGREYEYDDYGSNDGGVGGGEQSGRGGGQGGSQNQGGQSGRGGGRNGDTGQGQNNDNDYVDMAEGGFRGGEQGGRDHDTWDQDDYYNYGDEDWGEEDLFDEDYDGYGGPGSRGGRTGGRQGGQGEQQTQGRYEQQLKRLLKRHL